MKSKSVIAVSFVFAVLFILLGATYSFTAQGGRLTISRVANFGERISLSISIDGKEVARLNEGRNYDGTLAPGRHVISATVVPNLVDSPVWQKEINVQPGQNYSFTAIWQGQKMVLVKN